jgi:hypothetical protein
MNPYGFNPYRYIVASRDQSVVGFGEIHKEMGVCLCVWRMCVPTIVSWIPFFVLLLLK